MRFAQGLPELQSALHRNDRWEQCLDLSNMGWTLTAYSEEGRPNDAALGFTIKPEVDWNTLTTEKDILSIKIGVANACSGLIPAYAPPP